MQRTDVIAACFLLAIQWECQAVDIRFANHEALLSLLIGHQRNVESLLCTVDQTLLHIEIADRHGHILFQGQGLLLGTGLRHLQVTFGDVVLTFPYTPIY